MYSSHHAVQYLRQKIQTCGFPSVISTISYTPNAAWLGFGNVHSKIYAMFYIFSKLVGQWVSVVCIDFITLSTMIRHWIYDKIHCSYAYTYHIHIIVALCPALCLLPIHQIRDLAQQCFSVERAYRLYNTKVILWLPRAVGIFSWRNYVVATRLTIHKNNTSHLLPLVYVFVFVYERVPAIVTSTRRMSAITPLFPIKF
jgi:hypothetical protein